eukprot:Nk52_evm16s270 gene=Nk52_evmTU16s270
MTVNPEDLVRENIKSLLPYRCARDDYSEGILLDANENDYGPCLGSESNNSSTNSGPDGPSVYVDELNRYPDPYQKNLKDLICNYRKNQMESENIFLGVGSDEAIDLIMRIFCVPGKDAIVISTPTYGMYKVSAAINDIKVVDTPLNVDFQLCPKDIVNAATNFNSNSDCGGQAKLLFICSPNNPTGNCLRREDIVYLIEHFPGIVIVDEAYVDFATESKDGGSFCGMVRNYRNLMVLQTFSKSFGLAGLRLGVAFGYSYVIDMLNRAKAPYNISDITSQIGVKAMKNVHIMEERVTQTKRELARVSKILAESPHVERVYPSHSNFLLVKIKSPSGSVAEKIYRTMANEGVVIRFRGNERHCKECLRITVGTPEHNDQMVSLLNSTAFMLICDQ